MNIMRQILDRFRKMSDEEVAETFKEALVEHLDGLSKAEEPHIPYPSFLSEEEEQMLGRVLGIKEKEDDQSEGDA